MREADLRAIQAALTEDGFDAWLFADFRGSDPIAARVLGLGATLVNGAAIRGCDVDAAVRAVIDRAGFGAYFVHRTGHSIGIEVHGNGANIDGFETPDTRRLLPGTCFSIEPGVYLPGEFGVRSELNAFVDGRAFIVTGQPLQTAVVPILGEAT